MKNAVIIYNPNAGKEKGYQLALALKSEIKDIFDEIKLLETHGKDDATNFALEASLNEYHSIFAIGGDGTVREVVQGIIMSKREDGPILGIIPGGTFNGVTRILDYPILRPNIIKALKFNRYEYMDVGLCNDKVFNMIYSIGDIPESLHSTPSEDKALFSMFAYAFNVAKNSTKNSYYPLKITINGKEHEGKFNHLAVVLSPALNKFTNLPNLKRNDGYLHLYGLRHTNLIEKFSIIPDIIGGSIEDNDYVYYGKAMEILIESDGQVITDLDGDKNDPVPSTLKVLPKALKVYSLSKDSIKF